MNIQRNAVAALLVAVLSVSSTRLTAQPDYPVWSGFRDVHHRNDCRLASQVITKGRPANKREWALRTLPSCGPMAGEAVAGVIRSQQTATAPTEDLELVLSSTIGLLDRSIYSAAIEVAKAVSATEVGRVQAMRFLYSQISPESFGTYGYFVGEDTGTVVSVSDTYPRVGEPLVSGYLAEVVREMEAIRTDPRSSSRVRHAAEEVEQTARAVIRRNELCPPGTDHRDCLARLRSPRP